MDSFQPMRILAVGDPKTGKTRTGVNYLSEAEIDELRTFTIIDPATNKPRIFEKPTKSGKIKKIPMIVKAVRRVIYIGTEFGLDELRPTKNQATETRWIDPSIINPEIEILDDTDSAMVRDTGFAVVGKRVNHAVAMNRVECVLQDIKRELRREQFSEVASMFAHKKHGILPLVNFIAKKKRKKKENVTENELYDEILFEEWIKDCADKVKTMYDTLNNFEQMFLIALYKKIRGSIVFDTLTAYWIWLQDYRASDLMGLDVEQLRRLVPTREALSKEKGKQLSDKESKYNYDGMMAWNKVSSIHSTQMTLLKNLPVDLWLIMQYANSKNEKTGRLKIRGNKSVQYDVSMVVHFDKVGADPFSPFPNGTVKAEITDMRTNMNIPKDDGETRIFMDRDITFANLIRLRSGKKIIRQFSVEPEIGLGASEDELLNMKIVDEVLDD